jgi:GntR family transcriptional regulator
MIDRGPSLTDQVKAHLKERIVGGEFDGGRIPPETELATELGVSRTTVREALGRLEHEGAIIRRQGSGTYVNPPGLQIKSRLEEIWSYEQVLQDHGYTPSVRVVEVGREGADADDAALLDVAPGTPLLTMEKLFLEDDAPVVLTFNRLPAHLVDGRVGPSDARLPIFDFLEARAGRSLAYYVSEIVPTVLDDRHAGLLGVEVGTPAIRFDEIGYDAEGRPLVRAVSRFRDDLVRFKLIRRRV